MATVNCIGCNSSAGCVDCEYCSKKNLYCKNPECKNLGWSLHEQDCNVVTVDTETTTAFTPKVSGNPKDSATLLKYYNPKGSLVQKVVKNEVITRAQDENLVHEYDMDIQLSNGKSLKLESLENTVYPEATGIAGRLYQSRGDGSTSHWSGPLDLEAPVAGTVSIQLKDSSTGNIITKVQGVYDLEDVQDTKGRILTDEQKEYRIKNPNKYDQYPNVKVFQAINEDGEHATRLTFVNNKLVDVEIHHIEPTNDQLVGESYHFRCDPNDVDHITGLVMAMEDSGLNFGDKFTIINEHRKVLEKVNNSTEASPKVNAAVQSATKMLWEHVSSQAQQRKFVDKLTRGGDTMAVQLAYQLYLKMQGARTKSGIKKPLGWAQKKVYRRDLEDLRAAIDQVAYGPASPSVNGNYSVALSIITQALNPTNPCGKPSFEPNREAF